MQDFIFYSELGLFHVLDWKAYDHLLFLAALTLPFSFREMKTVFWLVTLFTFGHTFSLVLSAFEIYSPSEKLIELLIPVTILIAALSNIIRDKRYGSSKNLEFGFSLFFGLIHGFGLSTRLQQLPLGEKGSTMLGRIISFNIGVELGQIVALTIMLFILSTFRKMDFFKRFSKIANDGLILAGFMLLLMQLHGYLHTSNPDEFGFSEDNHYHHHMKMDQLKNIDASTPHDNL